MTVHARPRSFDLLSTIALLALLSGCTKSAPPGGDDDFEMRQVPISTCICSPGILGERGDGTNLRVGLDRSKGWQQETVNLAFSPSDFFLDPVTTVVPKNSHFIEFELVTRPDLASAVFPSGQVTASTSGSGTSRTDGVLIIDGSEQSALTLAPGDVPVEDCTLEHRTIDGQAAVRVWVGLERRVPAPQQLMLTYSSGAFRDPPPTVTVPKHSAWFAFTLRPIGSGTATVTVRSPGTIEDNACTSSIDLDGAAEMHADRTPPRVMQVPISTCFCTEAPNRGAPTIINIYLEEHERATTTGPETVDLTLDPISFFAEGTPTTVVVPRRSHWMAFDLLTAASAPDDEASVHAQANQTTNNESCGDVTLLDAKKGTPPNYDSPRPVSVSDVSGSTTVARGAHAQLLVTMEDRVPPVDPPLAQSLTVTYSKDAALVFEDPPDEVQVPQTSLWIAFALHARSDAQTGPITITIGGVGHTITVGWGTDESSSASSIPGDVR